MKLLKKVMMLVLALTITSSVSFAQSARKTAKVKDSRQTVQTKTPAEKANRMAKRLTKRLSLDAKQANSVHQLLQDYAVEFQTLRDEKAQSTDRTAAKEAIVALRARLDTDMYKILNPDQQQAYIQFNEEREAKRATKRTERQQSKRR